MTPKDMRHALTLWMMLFLLLMVAETLWSPRSSVAFWVIGLLPLTMLLAGKVSGPALALGARPASWRHR